MEEKKLILRLFPFYEDDMTQADFDVFLKLCPKAKQVVFNELYRFDEDNCFCFYKMPEFLVDLTPIEQIFYVSFLIANHRLYLDVGLRFSFGEQQEIFCKNKKYICDFVVNGLDFGFGFEKELSKKIIIECDGYESHHTKQQRNKDTERENNLKLEGFSVIRFTGSQIYNDPYKCSAQTIAFCIRENEGFIVKQRKEIEEARKENAKKDD